MASRWYAIAPCSRIITLSNTDDQVSLQKNSAPAKFVIANEIYCGTVVLTYKASCPSKRIAAWFQQCCSYRTLRRGVRNREQHAYLPYYPKSTTLRANCIIATIARLHKSGASKMSCHCLHENVFFKVKPIRLKIKNAARVASTNERAFGSFMTVPRS